MRLNSSRKELPFRQLHLDFHTSPLIPEVADQFDAAAFIEHLKIGRVNSVNLYAKCHHGMCYYPTAVGTRHPGLKFDLFGEMIRACRSADIGVMAYFTIGWEEDAARRHPEWQQVDRNGVLGGKQPFTSNHYSWRHLCHRNPAYKAYIKAQLDEIMDRYDVDGFWFDIIFQIGCICSVCVQSMKEMGLNPEREADVAKHDYMTINGFCEEMTAYVHARKPDWLIYYNTCYLPDISDTEFNVQARTAHNTHIEIESLPAVFWGYNHFPAAVNFHNAQNYETVGMTGIFHKCWGDFGSLKNREALEYECFRMLAYGAKCSVGDQMHPNGLLDKVKYERIGEVYRSVEEKEPWCANTSKVAEIGIVTARTDLSERNKVELSDEGAMRMLLELHQPFDFVTSRMPLDKYKLLILPDSVKINPEFARKLSQFIQGGGAVIASHQSGFDGELAGFALSELGVVYEGEAEFAPDYVRLGEALGRNIPPMDYVFYSRGTKVRAVNGTETLAVLRHPYFNRTYETFSSHCQTAPDRVTTLPAITRNGRVIYIAKPLFKDYVTSGSKVYRDIVENCLRLLLPEPLIRSGLPKTAEITLRRQGERHILHLLHYIPQRKSREMEIVEDIIPLYNQSVSVRMPRRPDRVFMALTGHDVEFTYEGGYVNMSIPEITGHAMVVIE